MTRGIARFVITVFFVVPLLAAAALFIAAKTIGSWLWRKSEFG